jgi:hypothetical protein
MANPSEEPRRQRPRVVLVAVEPADAQRILPGCLFADAYAMQVPPGVDAPAATRRAFACAPSWIRALLGLRNRLVAIAGLKAAPSQGFPVLAETAEEVVLGFDDRHLDFRIVVAIVGGRATLTTLVRWHNAWGRAYLRTVMPFHRRIAPRMLEAAAWR